MRLKDNGDSLTLWLSARDTYDWAWRAGAHWPCSEAARKRLCASFDTNGLCDLTVDGRSPGHVIPSDEFNAITSDFLAECLEKDHPCYFVTVGQFR